jgi:hypothetical protein
MATQEVILVGALPNDGTGDPLRVAFQKINNNFSNLFSTSYNTSEAISVGNTSGQVVFETPANTFTQGMFQVRSYDPGTPDTQNVNISASITNNLAGIRFTAYGTTFVGNALCRYDMDIAGGNVRLKVDPLVNTVVFHFVSSQVTTQGVPPPGLDIQLDGYPVGSIMSTENDLLITTESP